MRVRLISSIKAMLKAFIAEIRRNRIKGGAIGTYTYGFEFRGASKQRMHLVFSSGDGKQESFEMPRLKKSSNGWTLKGNLKGFAGMLLRRLESSMNGLLPEIERAYGY